MKRILILLAFVASGALAMPEPLRGTADWQRWGSGEMRWFGLSLYRTTLWVAGSTPASDPLALVLEYRRDIPRERLVDSSLDEMRRLGASEAQLRRWEPELRRVFPDVREGETIVGVNYRERGAAFFHQGTATGEIGDGEFARFFFGIWLDPESRSPSLRTALLKKPGT